MRIESPPPELTGEVLTRKVPKDWDPKGSIYADQFLGHLCPPDLDDEQRRQFFCILDLRRLKYAADEIFCAKGWKLNVINFAKEFEKSRSIIMLHYGLYEFQNVKPSKELIKRWRREHGLPALEDDEADAARTPSKPASSKKKRKAIEDSFDEVPASSNRNKRRAPEKGDADETPTAASTPLFSKNKRKASVDEDAESQPSKKQPSGSRSLFEKIANKTSTTPAASPSKPNPFAPKPAGNSLMQSVLKNNAKTEAAQPAASTSNIFGHLSDSGSAKNSGQDADAESETDSEPEASPEADQSDEPSAKRPALASATETGTPSAAGTRESTPDRSLFDRVTKGGDGQPIRAEAPTESSSSTKDQTWNPSTTPIKFAPTTTSAAPTNQGSSLFANSGAASGGALFAPKPATTSSNLFAAAKEDKPAEKETGDKATEKADQDGGESDKENDSQGPNKSAQPQPGSGSSLFQAKPASAEAPKEAEPAKPSATSNLFGAAASKPATSGASGLFGSANKPAESTPAATVMQSSTLFGAKPSEPEKPAASEPAKPAPAFGAGSTTTNDQPSTGSLFAPKPASTGSNLFGSNASPAPAKPLFGNTSSTASATSTTTAPAPAAPTPSFSFGPSTTSDAKPNGISQEAPKPLFGAPKSPPASTGASSMFDGSPMKQDDRSPAKPLFGGGNNTASSTPSFSFGGAPQSAPASNLFGGASTTPANNGNTAGSNGNIFGANQPAVGGSGGFNFNFGAGSGSSSGTGFNNPFSSGANQAGGASGSNAGGMFNFGASSGPSSAPSTGGMFQFGAGSSNTGSTAPSGGLFGANQSNTNGTPAFGGSAAPSSGPVFNFGGGQSQPPQNQNTAPAFLQPPSGGLSTGTSKSPFPGRKIAPLKRRV